ncbi:methyltransferase [candidate division WOR-3 bacterium]|nr:methyltransferase [candidate division WOR-3 bacterium]
MKDIHPVKLKKYGVQIKPAQGYSGRLKIPKSAQYIMAQIEKEKNLGTVTVFGAGPGFLSLPLSKFCEKVIAVEWNLTPYRILKENIRKNSLKNVFPVLSFDLREKSDLIVVNLDPHGGRELTVSMFQKSLKALKEGGGLLFAGRRDFGAKWYQKYLKTLFENVEVLDITGGYRVIKCVQKKDSEPQNFARELVYNGKKFMTLPGVFSRKKIDEGSKLLIQNVKTSKHKKIIDFGGGYGAIGLSLSGLAQKCYLIENNLIAIKCCAKNLCLNKAMNCQLIFEERVPENLFGTVDLFVSNPPTHFGGNTADFIIDQAYRALAKDGVAAFVVHRTGGYSSRLKHVFKNVEIEENGFYSVLKAKKCS